MRRDHRRPFDIEANDAADVTQQFWGATRGWAPEAEDDLVDDGWVDRTPRSLLSIKSSIAGMRRRPPQRIRRSDATGRIDRTRSHGIPRPIPVADLQAARREVSLGELAAGWIDDDEWPELDDLTPALASTRRNPRVAPSWRDDDRLLVDAFDDDDEFDAVDHDLDDEQLVPLSPVAPLASKLGLGAVDPLLARLGAIIVLGVLLLPFALSARDGSHDALAGTVDTVPSALAASAASIDDASAPAAAGAVAAPSTSAAAASTLAVAASDGGDESTSAGQDTPADVVGTESATPAEESQQESVAATTVSAADVPESATVSTAPVEVATVSQQADRVAPDCSLTYEAGAGDSWYRIADAAGVTPRALMDQNLAGLETPIFPGDEICLPEGATVPAKPVVSTAAPSTAPPTTASAATTTTATTTTTVKTTTPPPAPVSTAEVQTLIREIWPDELEERALQIADRESHFRSNAYNGGCCYGVFQIHWGAHRNWLDDYGIATDYDLFDARKNITAAYALYQRSGGWGPWGG